MLKKTKYVFRNPEPPGELEREIIARNLVRSLEKIAKFQIEQLSGESWTHLKILAPDGLVKIFKRISDKSLKPIIKGNNIYIYIDINVFCQYLLPVQDAQPSGVADLRRAGHCRPEPTPQLTCAAAAPALHAHSLCR